MKVETTTTKPAKRCSFVLYFRYNFKDNVTGVTRERGWAKGKRNDALVYLKILFENKAQFSCIAKDENVTSSYLMLRGYLAAKHTLNGYWENIVVVNILILETWLLVLGGFWDLHVGQYQERTCPKYLKLTFVQSW
jgi:hypothetical protein